MHSFVHGRCYRKDKPGAKLVTLEQMELAHFRAELTETTMEFDIVIKLQRTSRSIQRGLSFRST